jgi:tetratricopeptide (TPR) repeat protein
MAGLHDGVERRGAEEVVRNAREIAIRNNDFYWTAASIVLGSIMTYFDGRLEEAVADLERALASVRGSGIEGGISNTVLFGGLRPIINLGAERCRDSAVTRVVVEQFDLPIFRGVPLYQAHSGQHAQVSERLDRMLEARPDIVSHHDKTMAWLDAAYLESAVIVGHKRTAELLLERFAGNTMLTSGYHWPTCIPRHLGGAAALLERYDEARKHYQEAIRVCTEMRFRPELALTRLQLAELLLDHYPDEKKDALGHLDFAIKEFREMKMQPSLERALRHKDILKA